MYDLCLKNGLIINENESYYSNVYVKDGRISLISQDGNLRVQKTIDIAGKYLFPGAIDPHVHLNDPGLTESEDFFTGTCAAAAGGITTLLEHPLTLPLPATIEAFADKLNIVSRKAVVDFGLWGAAVPGNIHEIKQMIKKGAIAFKAFLPYSTEIPSIDDGSLLETMNFLSEKDMIIGIHCENDDIIKKYQSKYEEQGLQDPQIYVESRPEIAEIEASGRVALFASKTGVRTHIVHCSSPEAVEVSGYYQKKGAPISLETCMHYLLFNVSDLGDLGIYGICNPPLRSKKSVEALWEKVKNNKINSVCSDHAAYTFAEKDAGLANIFDTPPGVTGIQTWVPLLFSEGVKKRGLDLHTYCGLISTNAARIFDIYPRKGKISVGSDADFLVLDPEKKWNIKEEDLFYKQKWSPFIGCSVEGNVELTIVRGEVVYQQGKIMKHGGFGQYIQPDAN